MLQAIGQRLTECGLQLHPDKTRIVYCKADGRPGSHEHETFDFLGYTFGPRSAATKTGRVFVGFLPAVSNAAAKSMRQEIRRWRLHQWRRLHQWTRSNLQDLATFINPIVRGWINYYGRFYRSRLISKVLQHINEYLIRWAMWKHKRMRRSRRSVVRFLARIARSQPDLFGHWRLAPPYSAG